jgi:hypothetical protein
MEANSKGGIEYGGSKNVTVRITRIK